MIDEQVLDRATPTTSRTAPMEGPPPGGTGKPSTRTGPLGALTGTLVGRLVAMVLVILLPWGAISLYNLVQARGLGAQTQELYDTSVVSLADLVRLVREAGEVSVATRNHLLAADDAERADAEARFEESVQEFDSVVEHYVAVSPEGGERRAALEQIQSEFGSATAQIREDVLTRSATDPVGALAVFRDEGARDALDATREQLRALRDVETGDAEAWAADAAATSTAIAQQTTLVLFVLVVGSLGASVWFARRLAAPICQAADALQRGASGDLTVRTEVASKDEVGEMACSLNTMLGELGETIADIADNSTTLAAASEELSAISSSLTTDAATADAQVETVTQAAADASANVSTAAAAAQELTASIAEISRNVAQSVEIARSASAEAERATATMHALEAASTEIGDVVVMISAIAQQTDLLALNATIEAARAGEMGRGFAVVATEVKDLAKESSEAAQDVTARIESMQANAQEAIGAIESVATTIESINETSETIAAAVEEQNAATSEIARSLDTAATSTSGIDTALGEVSAAVANTSRNARESERASTELSRMAARLSKLVTRFDY